VGEAGNSSDTAAADSGSSSSKQCGYIYCDMAELRAGAEQPWKCDVCGVTVANNTAELWGR
jgi:ribosomal protein L37AE/L43A